MRKSRQSGISNTVHQEFFHKCMIKDNLDCLILLQKWEPRNDIFYSNVIEKIINLIDERDNTQDLPLAIAMSKCERREIWPGHPDPELDIFKIHLPRTTNILKKRIPQQKLQFYAISTFSVLPRNDPRPSPTDKLGSPHSILREPLK